MGLFNSSKKSTETKPVVAGPYKDSSINFVYQLLFCDNISLYKEKNPPPHSYPYDILFSDKSSVSDLQRIVDDRDTDPRVKVLASNLQLAKGHQPADKELFGVIVEVGLDEGLDVLASFSNGTARYINHTEKLLVWEVTDDKQANELTNQLFENSRLIVDKIGAWDKPRKPHPPTGMLRISFLVSDGLYFGEGPMNYLFNDAFAAPALNAATKLMQYLTTKSLETKK